MFLQILILMDIVLCFLLEYLGIPYSDDMGEARRSACNASLGLTADGLVEQRFPRDDGWLQYVQAGFTDSSGKGNDPAGDFLPLVHQTKQGLNYTVLEQPLDFTFLAGKYKVQLPAVIQTLGLQLG